MRELLQELQFRVRAGPARATRWIFDRLTDRAQDRRFGIETAGTVHTNLGSRDFVHYQPVSYRDLAESLALAKLTPDDVFLDAGCGMGRAVCVAATYPLRRVIGVELSPDLCRVARENIARIEHKLACRDVQIVNANALEYGIPPDVSLLFLFNPLSGAALCNFFARVRDSCRQHPRGLRVLFTGTVSSIHFEQQAHAYSFLQLVSKQVLSTGARALLYNVQDQP